jgi:hypothetical protein
MPAVFWLAFSSSTLTEEEPGRSPFPDRQVPCYPSVCVTCKPHTTCRFHPTRTRPVFFKVAGHP